MDPSWAITNCNHFQETNQPFWRFSRGKLNLLAKLPVEGSVPRPHHQKSAIKESQAPFGVASWGTVRPVGVVSSGTSCVSSVLSSRLERNLFGDWGIDSTQRNVKGCLRNHL